MSFPDRCRELNDHTIILLPLCVDGKMHEAVLLTAHAKVQPSLSPIGCGVACIEVRADRRVALLLLPLPAPPKWGVVGGVDITFQAAATFRRDDNRRAGGAPDVCDGGGGHFCISRMAVHPMVLQHVKNICTCLRCLCDMKGPNSDGCSKAAPAWWTAVWATGHPKFPRKG